MPGTTLAGFSPNMIRQGVRAIVGDHAGRGSEWALRHNVIGVDGPMPRISVVHDIGALLVLQEWIERGWISAIDPDVRHTEAYCRLGLRVLTRQILRPPLRPSEPPWGHLGLPIIRMRLRCERWWEDGMASDGLHRMPAAFSVSDDVIDALADLLWANRSQSDWEVTP